LETFRPGHADYTYQQKYGIRDPRGGGRSSARLTAPVVAAAGIAKKWLKEHYGIQFTGYMTQLGDLTIPFEDLAEISNNPFFAPNKTKIAELEAYMDALRKEGDSCGAKITIQATGMPVGLGSATLR
jgi:chorismate synthase